MLISAVILLATSGLWLLLYLVHVCGLSSPRAGSIETGVVRTLSERTDDNGDRPDSVVSLFHGVTAMAMTIGTYLA